MTKQVAALALAAGLLVGTSSQAKIITATYTGAITSGIDVSGVFGAPNMSLSGDLFTALFVFDDNLGIRTFSNGIDDLFGDSDPNSEEYPSPLLSASLIVNGRSAGYSGGFAEFAAEDDGLHPTNITENPDSHGVSSEIHVYVFDPLSPTKVDIPFTSSVSSPIGGNFILADGGRIASGSLDPSLTVTVADAPISGAPEPGIWALLIAGIGAIGASLRRRQRMSAYA